MNYSNRDCRTQASPAAATKTQDAHTPGPWTRTVCKNEGYVSVISGADDSGVCEVHGEANARLIAAAPTMLEALQQAAFAIPTDHGAFETVRAAIAQATNPQP